MHSHPPVDPDVPVNADHQDNDIDQKVVIKFIVASFVVTILTFVAMLLVIKIYKVRFQSERGVASIENRQIPTEDQSLLQVTPLVDLDAYYTLEGARLNPVSNSINGIAIESAMHLMVADHAFPVRTGYVAPVEAAPAHTAPAHPAPAKGASH